VGYAVGEMNNPLPFLLCPEDWPETGNLNWRWHHWRSSQSLTEWFKERNIVNQLHENAQFDLQIAADAKRRKMNQFKPPMSVNRPRICAPVQAPVTTNATAQQVEKLIEVVCKQKREYLLLLERVNRQEHDIHRLASYVGIPSMNPTVIVIDESLTFGDEAEFNKFYQELHQY